MTDTSIRAELRRAAMTDDPWNNGVGLVSAVAGAFCCPRENVWWIDRDHTRWFFLLVAEAL